jgi:hypothetical protein
MHDGRENRSLNAHFHVARGYQNLGSRFSNLWRGTACVVQL